MTHTISLIIAIVLLSFGVVLAFIPMMPALLYMFLVALAFAVFGSIALISLKSLVLLACITAASIAVDHAAGVLGARYGGAHMKSLGWGFVGILFGTFIFPAIGTFAGLFIGVLLSELYLKKTHGEAFKAATGAIIGKVVGMGVNIALAIAFLVSFILLAVL